MRPKHGLSHPIAGLALTLVLMLHPAGESHATGLPGFESFDITPTAITPLPNGGLLVHGSWEGRFLTSRRTDEFAPIGEARLLLPSWDYLFQASDAGMDAQPIQSAFNAFPLIVSDAELNHLCRASRDFNGIDSRLFSTDLALDLRHPAGGVGARFAAFNPGDSNYRISVFDVDCDRTDVATVPSTMDVQIRQATSDRAYALTFPGPMDGPQRPMLHSVTRAGIDWQVELGETDPVLQRIEFAATAEGGVVLYQPSGATLHEYDASGVERWNTAVTGLGDVTYLFRQGTLSILAAWKDDASGGVVKTFDGEGNLLSTRDLTGTVQYQLLPGPDQTLVFREEPVTRSGMTLPVAEGLVTVDAQGQWHTLLDRSSGYAPMARVSSGDLIVRPAGLPRSLLRIDPDDVNDPQFLDTAARLPRRTAGVQLDGDSVFLLEETLRGTLRLSHLDRAGSERWAHDLPDPPGVALVIPNHTAGYKLASDGERICMRRLGRDGAVLCRLREDGTAVFDWQSDDTWAEAGTLAFDAQGRLTTTSIGCDGNDDCDAGPLRIRRYAADGSIEFETSLTAVQGQGGLVHFVDGGDRLAVGREDDRSELSVVNLDGARPWSILDSPRKLRPLGFDREGRLLVMDSAAFPNIELTLLGTDTQSIWARVIDVAVNHPSYVKAVALAAGDWILVENHEPGTSVHASSRSLLSRWSGGTGETVWSTWVRDRGPGDLSLAEEAGIALLTENASAPARGIAIDLANGEVRSALPIGMPRPGAHGFDPGVDVFARPLVALAADGFAVTSAPDFGSDEVEVAMLPASTWLDPDMPPPASATRGIWHADDSSGQGLFLDLYAFTNQAFGGWFTYALEGGHVASELRWYTMLSRDEAAAETVFDIYRNDAGQFAEPPVTSATLVGSATLRLLGCDRAVFSYRFSAATHSPESDGSIPLRRSAGAGCDDAPVPRPSGAWFRPEQSGQGLFFMPTAEQAGGHQFAAAWFTYDPAGLADDAFAHSWFTLLGDIGDDGHGTMTIFRTLGGAFDRGRTDNSRALGTVEITLDGCSGMRLDYAFSPGLHAYAEREGTIELVRLGNCPSE